MMKVVLFHKNCHDGLFSAFSVWKKFGCKDVIYIDVNYKPIQDMEPMEALDYIFNSYIKHPLELNPAIHTFKDNKVTIEDMADMELIVVDYSFPVDHLLTYVPLFKKITVLDHHKTAIEDYSRFNASWEGEFGWKYIRLSGNCEIVFSFKESGAKLTWLYFHGTYKPVPDYIELISDYDLWTFNLENTKNFDYGLKLQDLTSFNVIDVLMNSYKHDIINVGAKYQRMHLKRIEKIVKSNIINVMVKIDNKFYTCGLINAYPDIRNEVCDYALKTMGYEIAIAYNIYSSAEVTCSVRSINDVDSTKLSIMYGGGGHKNSSACRFTFKQLNAIIKSKIIDTDKKYSFNFLKRLLEIFK